MKGSIDCRNLTLCSNDPVVLCQTIKKAVAEYDPGWIESSGEMVGFHGVPPRPQWRSSPIEIVEKGEIRIIEINDVIKISYEINFRRYLSQISFVGVVLVGSYSLFAINLSWAFVFGFLVLGAFCCSLTGYEFSFRCFLKKVVSQNDHLC